MLDFSLITAVFIGIAVLLFLILKLRIQAFISLLIASIIAIASGASIVSHVNDSGFWLVSKYLGLNEKQTFKSWSVMTTLLALTGFITVSIFALIF